MAEFKVEIETGGAAFDGAPGFEIARILRGLADRVEAHPTEVDGKSLDVAGFVLLDINGNRVGGATWTP